MENNNKETVERSFFAAWFSVDDPNRPITRTTFPLDNIASDTFQSEEALDAYLGYTSPEYKSEDELEADIDFSVLPLPSLTHETNSVRSDSSLGSSDSGLSLDLKEEEEEDEIVEVVNNVNINVSNIEQPFVQNSEYNVIQNNVNFNGNGGIGYQQQFVVPPPLQVHHLYNHNVPMQPSYFPLPNSHYQVNHQPLVQQTYYPQMMQQRYAAPLIQQPVVQVPVQVPVVHPINLSTVNVTASNYPLFNNQQSYENSTKVGIEHCGSNVIEEKSKQGFYNEDREVEYFTECSDLSDEDEESDSETDTEYYEEYSEYEEVEESDLEHTDADLGNVVIVKGKSLDKVDMNKSAFVNSESSRQFDSYMKTIVATPNMVKQGTELVLYSPTWAAQQSGENAWGFKRFGDSVMQFSRYGSIVNCQKVNDHVCLVTKQYQCRIWQNGQYVDHPWLHTSIKTLSAVQQIRGKQANLMRKVDSLPVGMSASSSSFVGTNV